MTFGVALDQTDEGEREVRRISRFLRDGHGAVTIGSIAIGTCIVSISALVAMALSTEIPASPTVGSGVAIAPDSGDVLQLTQSVALPVGSVVVHSDGSFTSFKLPTGEWLDVWSNDVAVPVGSVLTSPTQFTTEDGQILDAARFASSTSEAYSEQVKYAFK